MKEIVKKKKSKPLKVKSSKKVELNQSDSMNMYHTLGTKDQDIAVITIQELTSILPDNISNEPRHLNAALAMLHDLKPVDTFERMLIVQIVACHTMSMYFSRKAMIHEQYIDAMDKHINRATKLMRAFNMHSEALLKYRGKGQQTIKVQHINVQDNAQAIVGDVGGGK